MQTYHDHIGYLQFVAWDTRRRAAATRPSSLPLRDPLFSLKDAALRAVTWALHTNPHAFPLVPGYSTLRVATTDEVVTDDGTTIAALSVIFRILDDDYETVDLLYIEASDPESDW